MAMRLLLVLLFCCHLAALEQPTPALAHHSLTIDGTERTFNAYVPGGADLSQPRQLILGLHGFGGNGAQFRSLTQRYFEGYADVNNAMVVYPDGMNNRWYHDRTGPDIFDDVSFLRGIIEFCAQHYHSYPTHVLLTGVSNGGLMSFRFARQHPELCAALAPIVVQIPDPWDNGATYFQLSQPVATELPPM